MSDERKLPQGWGEQQVVPGTWKSKSSQSAWDKKVANSSKREKGQQELRERQVEFKEESQEHVVIQQEQGIQTTFCRDL